MVHIVDHLPCKAPCTRCHHKCSPYWSVVSFAESDDVQVSLRNLALLFHICSGSKLYIIQISCMHAWLHICIKILCTTQDQIVDLVYTI